MRAPRRFLFLLAAPVVLSAILAGCTAPAPPTPADDEVWMEPVNLFTPLTRTVDAGTEVTFINRDTIPHTVTSDEEGVFDSGFMSQGGSWSYTFDEPGTYTYHCIPHSAKDKDSGKYKGMVGTIVVVAANATDD